MANELKFGSKVVFLNGFAFTSPQAASDPGTAVAGDFYYNTTTNTLHYYNGTAWQVISTTATAGTVTSVSLADGDATTIFSISGSPITSSGTISLSLANQSANTVLAGPISGGVAQPTFRSLVAGDIPSLAYANQTLSNLSGTTSINQDLVPLSTARNIGTATLFWNSAFISLLEDNAGLTSIDVFNRALLSPNGSTQLSWTNSGVEINSNPLNMNSNKITNLAAGTVATDGVNYGQVILANGSNAFSANQSLGGFVITNSGAPVNPNDLVSKNYVDNLVQGLNWKETARSATTGALPANTYNNGTAGVGATLTGNANGALPAQDGVTLVLNDRLLVKNEAAPANNGIYFVSQVGSGGTPYILTRTLDSNTAVKLQWATIEISPDSATMPGFIYRESDDITTIGTDPVVFTQVSQGLSYVFTSGVQIAGNVVSANVDNSTIDVNGSNQLEVKAGGITNTQISASAAIAYSKLALTGSIVNADINASAAIAFNKMAALTANIVPVTDASGFIVSSSASAVSLFSAALKRGLSGSNVVVETYNDSLTLTDNQASPQAVGVFQFAYASAAGQEIAYVIETGTTNVDTRVGTLRMVANDGGTVISSISDMYSETADCGVIWSATVSGANVVVSYTTTNQGANRTMRADVKQFRR